MLYWETFDVLESLVDGDAKQMLAAIRQYSQYGTLPDFSDSAILNTLWLLIRPKLDADAERYENIREQRRAAINSRWEKERSKVVTEEYESIQPYDGGIYSSGNVVTGRVVYDAFVLDNKRKALYVHYTTANGLTVTSAAGATGKTAVTVSPALISGNSYVYKTAASVDMPLTGDDLSSWTVWNGTVEISATAGNTIVIAEVDSAKKCVKAGKAVVVSG